jgi:hypothetical protein
MMTDQTAQRAYASMLEAFVAGQEARLTGLATSAEEYVEAHPAPLVSLTQLREYAYALGYDTAMSLLVQQAASLPEVVRHDTGAMLMHSAAE